MVKVKILDHVWRFYIHQEEKYISHFGDDSEALVIINDKEGHFNAAEFKLVTVKHELFHAFFSALPINSARLNAGQVEEVCCDTFSEHGDKINRLSRFVYKSLKEELE